jgi:hypothetical protein
MWRRILLAAVLLSAASLWAQVNPALTRGEIHVTYTEPADAGQADRLRDVAARVKGAADQLEPLDRVDIAVLHSRRELDLRVGPEGTSELTAVSYVHGILFLSPMSWQGVPTEEALEHEMRRALIRYTALRLAGGNLLPDWLDQGLVGVLAEQPFAPASAEPVAARASLLLAERQADDRAVGYWAVRYLIEARGGLAPLRQLLRLVAQRPDSFVENLQLTYGVPVGELERDWRAWMKKLAEEDRKKRDGRRDGPLTRDR